MLVGREEELSSLQKLFGKLTSSAVVLYGRKGIGKTSLIREFMKSKDSFYYSAIPSTADEQRLFMANCVYGPSELNAYLNGYEDIFAGITKDNNVKKVIVVDEFNLIVRNDSDFLNTVEKVIKNQADYGRVMVILITSSVSFVEANRKLFKNINTMTTFMKLEELSFMDTMRFFASYSIDDCVRYYGITGGMPIYISKLSKKQPYVENICRNVLLHGAYLQDGGIAAITEELRETSVYNTILGCLAMGMNKINDIYNYTGFGRDKISVYLKNLMERDFVEKVYSYDVSGRETIKKGCYRIRYGFVWFWYRYIYPNYTAVFTMEPQEFYDEYIKDDIDEFTNEAFIRVCSDYMKLLEEHDGIALKTVRCGRIYEKDNRIDIIREDKDGLCAVGVCDFSENVMKEETLTCLYDKVKNERINAGFYFLFSRSGFDEALRKRAQKEENLTLVDISDL